MAQSQPRHEFYETATEVVVSIFLKNLSPEDVNVTINADSVSVTYPPDSNTFELNPLLHSIDPNQSSHRVASVKIELKLAKAEPGIRWGSLVGGAGSETKGGPASSMATAGVDDDTIKLDQETNHKTSSYPSSSRNKVDWSALEKDLEAKEQAEEKERGNEATGDEGVQKLFQKLYADATPEQQRAMMKSYTESNGTTLSTNWEDVRKGKVETKPPDGMVAKKWDE